MLLWLDCFSDLSLRPWQSFIFKHLSVSAPYSLDLLNRDLNRMKQSEDLERKWESSYIF